MPDRASTSAHRRCRGEIDLGRWQRCHAIPSACHSAASSTSGQHAEAVRRARANRRSAGCRQPSADTTTKLTQGTAIRLASGPISEPWPKNQTLNGSSARLSTSCTRGSSRQAGRLGAGRPGHRKQDRDADERQPEAGRQHRQRIPDDDRDRRQRQRLRSRRGTSRISARAARSRSSAACARSARPCRRARHSRTRRPSRSALRSGARECAA